MRSLETEVVHLWQILVCVILTLSVSARVEDTIDFGGIGEVFGTSKTFNHAWKQGSGFFISADGCLLTDKGLVEGAENVVVVNAGKAYEADVLSKDKETPFALLKVRGGQFIPFAFSQVDTVHAGTRLSIVGYDVSDEDGCSPSVVKCVASESGRRKFKVFGNFSNAMAGGGVLDENGLVAGMLLRFGGRNQTECDVLSRHEIVKGLPSSIISKLSYTGGGRRLGLVDLHRRLCESVAVVLVYNDKRRKKEIQAAESVKGSSVEQRGKGGTISYDDLPKLTVSARNRRTHLAGSGSGFFVTADGYLLTNHHVVNGASELMVVFHGTAYRAELRAKNKKADLALLKLQGSFTPVSFSTEDECVVGQTIFVVGYPKLQLQGMEPKVTKGVISSRSGFRGEQTSYQMDAAIQPGNSGGPVADESGRVVGISVASLIGGQNVNYAIKLDEVMKFLPRGVGITRKQANRGRDFTDVVQEIVASTALVLNYAKGAAPLSFDAVAPDRREEVLSLIRKRVLYARLAKIKGKWKDVYELTESVLKIDPTAQEAKELNDLARMELGFHLVIIAQVDGRDVCAKIEPVSGFAESTVSCEKLLRLADKSRKLGFPVKANLIFKDDEGIVWVGKVDCIFDWNGTREIIVKMKREERK